MDDRSEDAEGNAEPPDRIVAAEPVVEIAAEPDAEERADLVRCNLLVRPGGLSARAGR